ncbi:MAG TPA: DUF2279 domain-containing protein [Thermoanaerobaculia bacterium]|nr:DUF2279 domain-containing protein [Thermoanaerobaculia bacterium]
MARLTAVALAGAIAAGSALAEPLQALTHAAAGTGFEESFARVLEDGGVHIEAPIEGRGDGGEEESAGAPAPQKVHSFWIGVVSGATLIGSAWNSFGDGPNQKWHFTREGWFGQNTYAGGGDKASHVVSYYIVAKLLTGVNMELGMKKDDAALLGMGVSMMAGLVTEIGDGRGKYGFSYEDLVMDWIGAVSALGIAHYGLDDLVGYRAGLLPEPAAVCCPYGGTGKDYTEEIYTADLKLAGLADRNRWNIGPARYLLFSVSYSAKGYPYADPLIRDRQVGFELGINFNEILRAVGVRPDKWWSKILYFAFDVLRIPYTQIGMYYGLNTHKWYGPGIGDQWLGK